LVLIRISLRDALVGFELDIEHLDGHFVHIKRTDVTTPGQVVPVQKEGMKNFDNNNVVGTLFVTFDVSFPTAAELEGANRASLESVLGPLARAANTYNGR
jgi:DnaJ homolog subfamily B member 11